jgi:N-acetylglucosamine kinase-like BadF-type ATPase
MSAPADLLLGVDGGATKTQAVIASLEGQVLARGLGPASNAQVVGLEKAFDAISTAIEGALVQLPGGGGANRLRSLAGERIAAAALGLAGVDTPAEEKHYVTWLRQLGFSGPLAVVNDTELILAGGTPDGWGVALVSAVGSNCVARTPDGRRARVGGWGHLLGDEGSSFRIAVEALRLATQTADGRASAEPLLKAALKHWSLATPEALITYVYRPATTQADIAELAGVVLTLAGNRDPSASAIVDQEARNLAAHVDAIVRKLGLTTPPLALGGGTLVGGGGFRQAVLAAIRTPLGPVRPVADPGRGAIALAGRLLAAR